MNIRFILFDLDDTLFPSTPAYQKGLHAAYQWLKKNRRISWPRFQAIYERARSDVKGQLGHSPSARNRLLYFKRFVEILEGRPRPDMILALMAAYNTCWASADVAPAQRLLQQLAHRFTLGVVTNQVGEMQMQKLMHLDPRGKWLKVVVTSEEIGVEKPAPKIFRKACRLAGCRPADTLLVGDSWSDDVQGGLRAGLRVAYLHDVQSHRAWPKGVISLKRLSDLPRILETSITGYP